MEHGEEKAVRRAKPPAMPTMNHGAGGPSGDFNEAMTR